MRSEQAQALGSPSPLALQQAPNRPDNLRRDTEVAFGDQTVDRRIEIEPASLGRVGEQAQGAADANARVHRYLPADSLVDQQEVGIASECKADSSRLAGIETFQPGYAQRRSLGDAEPAGRIANEAP